MSKGREKLNKEIPEVLGRIAERLPAVVIDTLREQWNGLEKLDEQVAQIECRMREWKKEDKAVKAISEITGVGLLTATAAVAMMGDAKAFKSGREFAAWAGLVPRQTGSGGKVKPHGISKRGDTYLRTLLIHGARSVLSQQTDTYSANQNMRDEMDAMQRNRDEAAALANAEDASIWRWFSALLEDRRVRWRYMFGYWIVCVDRTRVASELTFYDAIRVAKDVTEQRVTGEKRQSVRIGHSSALPGTAAFARRQRNSG